MNIVVGSISLVLLACSLVGAVHDIADKRSIFETVIPGINIAASGIGLSSGVAPHLPPQPIAVQVPHPVAVPVPHPIVVPIERPVPFPVDRPIPYPVPVIKKYFIPVPFKILKTVPVPVPATPTPDGSESQSGSSFDSRTEITAESYRLYRNGPGPTDVTNHASGNNDAIVESSLPATKSTKRNSSFRIHVNNR
ncbi:uncharacterized protein [Halyomorpha halys]|uniref:uncharacterized protein n=1 Tax=Halyomorpha halys TaxID=286706 RepID=UPI0006D4E874|nr:cyclin-dependent kinase inhibitor 1C-like [Halyomorpha halys]